MLVDVTDKDLLRPEGKLMKLPLPSLNQSIDGLIKATQPLQPADEFLETLRKLDLLKSNKLLNILQSHLEDYDSKHACYLDLFSNVRDHNATNIYSEYRGKTLPKNPYFILENDPNYWSLLPPKQSERAAILTFSTLKFIATIKKGQLTNDLTPVSKVPLSMKSFHYLFGSTRYPSAQHHGVNIKHFEDSQHLVILCNGKFYYLKVLNDANEVLIGQASLQKIFSQIIDEETSKQRTSYNISVSSLTTESRDEWHHSRKYFSISEINRKNLHLIDSSLLVINLDLNDFIVNDASSSYLNICHGTSDIDEKLGVQRGSCNSRWYDKLQLIITKDSLAAVVWEPTLNDATVVLRYVSDIYTDSILRLARNITNLKLFSLFLDIVINDQYDTLDDTNGFLYPLEWDFSDNRLLHRLHLAETRLGDLLCLFDSRTEILPFGSNFAKKIGVNVDSLVQLAIQLTHYALYGKIVSSCESISTRRFENARSELCFIQSLFILKIGQSFISNSSDMKRWNYFKQGIEEINKLKKDCRDGKGFEKHIKALQLAYLQKDYLNEIKSDHVPHIPELKELNSKSVPPFLLPEGSSDTKFVFDPEILAINCGNPSLKAFGITPFKPNGFGIGYIIKDDNTVFTISSNYRQNERFLYTLRWVFSEVENLYEKCEQKTSFSDSEGETSLPYTTADMIRSVSMTLSESLKTNADQDTLKEIISDKTTNNQHKNFNSENILGGYGYFDVGELEFRSQSNSRQISRVQSFSNLGLIKE